MRQVTRPPTSHKIEIEPADFYGIKEVLKAASQYFCAMDEMNAAKNLDVARWSLVTQEIMKWHDFACQQLSKQVKDQYN